MRHWSYSGHIWPLRDTKGLTLVRPSLQSSQETWDRCLLAWELLMIKTLKNKHRIPWGGNQLKRQKGAGGRGSVSLSLALGQNTRDAHWFRHLRCGALFILMIDTVCLKIKKDWRREGSLMKNNCDSVVITCDFWTWRSLCGFSPSMLAWRLKHECIVVTIVFFISEQRTVCHLQYMVLSVFHLHCWIRCV